MFRLKMINKPKLFKLKFNFIFPQIVLANMQEKEITPTKETQIVEPDRNYDGLKKVTVNKIPDEYIIPSGEIDITQNGTYNVADKATANVNIPEKQLGTKTITKNGIYKAVDDNLDGYSEVDIETSGVDINDYFKGTIEGANNENEPGWAKSFLKFRSPLQVVGNSADYMFCNYPLKEIPQIDTSNVTRFTSAFRNSKIATLPQINTSKATNMTLAFYSCFYLKTIPLLDTSNVMYMESMLSNCGKLETIPLLNTSKVINIQGVIKYCYSLTEVGGFENLGQAYETTQNANYRYYTLYLSDNKKLTHDSLMNVINNLYDIKTKGCKAQQLVLGSTNIAKLTSEEIAIATEKGWTVS